MLLSVSKEVTGKTRVSPQQEHAWAPSLGNWVHALQTLLLGGSVSRGLFSAGDIKREAAGPHQHLAMLPCRS